MGEGGARRGPGSDMLNWPVGTVGSWFHVKHDCAALSVRAPFPDVPAPLSAQNDVHTCDPVGSIVCRALHSKHISDGGSALRSKHAVPRTKEL